MMRSAVSAAAWGSSTSSSSTANSSPPKRAAVSDGPDRGRDALGDLEQQLIAGGVAEAVVDGLEVVEVEEDDRQAELLAPGAGDRVAHALVEQRAVGQVGDRVVEGLVGELLLEGLALAHVAAVEDDAADRGVLEQVGVQDLEVPDAAVAVREQALDRLGPAARAHDPPPEATQQADVLVGVQQTLEGLADELLGGEAEHLLDRRALVDDPHVGVEHRDEVRGVLDQGGEAGLAGTAVDLLAEPGALERQRDLVGQRGQGLAGVGRGRTGAGDDEQHARIAVGLVELEDERVAEVRRELQGGCAARSRARCRRRRAACRQARGARPLHELASRRRAGSTACPSASTRHMRMATASRATSHGRAQRGERDLPAAGGGDEHGSGRGERGLAGDRLLALAHETGHAPDDEAEQRHRDADDGEHVGVGVRAGP